MKLDLKDGLNHRTMYNVFLRKKKRLHAKWLFYFLILLLFCCCKNDSKIIKGDYYILKRIIQNNPTFFQNKNEEIPRRFYPSSLGISTSTQEEVFNDYSEFSAILHRNSIKEIYISSMKDIWFVIDEKRSFSHIKQKMIGFTDHSSIQESGIMYYNPKRVKKLQDNWYLIEIHHSIVN